MIALGTMHSFLKPAHLADKTVYHSDSHTSGHLGASTIYQSSDSGENEFIVRGGAQAVEVLGSPRDANVQPTPKGHGSLAGSAVLAHCILAL